jgi:hypothetical protein
MFLSNWPILSYGASAVISILVLFILHKKKLPWLYYFSFFLIAIIMLIMALSGTEI